MCSTDDALSRKRLKTYSIGKKKVRAACKGQWKSRKAGEAEIQKREKKATAILPVNTKKASFRAI